MRDVDGHAFQLKRNLRCEQYCPVDQRRSLLYSMTPTIQEHRSTGTPGWVYKKGMRQGISWLAGMQVVECGEGQPVSVSFKRLKKYRS